MQVKLTAGFVPTASVPPDGKDRNIYGDDKLLGRQTSKLWFDGYVQGQAQLRFRVAKQPPQ
jgi:hypothetical protein